MVTKCAFGQLKGRWGLIHRKREVNQHSLKVNVLACIVLHNIYIENRDSISRKLELSEKTFQKNYGEF